MEKDIFTYLEKDYRYLNNYIKDINEALFTSPHTAIIKGRTFIENLTQEIAKIEGYGLLNTMTQVERLRNLEEEGIFTEDIDKLFHAVRLLGNKAAHSNLEGELEAALNIHKNIYKITSWFVEVYVDPMFEALPYKNPMPSTDKSSEINEEVITKIMNKMMDSFIGKQQENVSINKENNPEVQLDIVKNKEDIDDAYTGMVLEGIFNDDEPDKKCLIQELSRLKESSKEAVESLGEFTPFKKYMHIVRDAQTGLDELIHKANESSHSQLILVCGSVGDGKSHIISYFNNRYPEIMKNFTLHNDATESLEPNKTSMDTLNEVLDEFSDEKIDISKEKFILAINLGTLNNFIDSKYGHRFTKLKEFVQDKKILESSIEDSSFNDNSSFQFVNFSDYHIFTLKDGKVHSSYIKSLIQKITQSLEIDFTEKNIFYSSYKRNCSQCGNKECCPIKANYELLAKDNIQDAIVELLVQCIVKNKIIISTRALLNFMYELIIPRSYIDVNSPTFKNKIAKLNNQEYIKSLIPNIIFEHKELSFIFEALNSIDPLNIRNEKIDDFVIEFNNASNILNYFKEYVDYPKGYINKINYVDFNETEDKKIRDELLKLFIRSYYICGRNDLFSLRDKDYDEYMNALFYWNKGNKSKLKNVYNNVKQGIMKWNGEADKDQINIFLGKNQIKYKISENIKLKADASNLPKNDDDDLKKFIETLKLKYKGEKAEKSYEIDIDYRLYKLLVQVNNGYRPNKKDKNHFIKFVEFINKLEESGSQNEELMFTEKNRENNKQFKLEYDEEFETYRFVEI
ncbi:DNA phosphorothioation-dependent restriction protein DptF [Clostridium taeniosporum]|uniref:DNA phosphorothioation-dependent restriction protein DptF n=1 Tax=Clostridium taeniosporum TaxID=394958 RepID=A0A1D7XKB8_9CLOT|nr:DNA phosphorothioation-dependent restriction protein DptF [Clostridium taeniosporum]AOR23772.1 DNA phosphorothioation-dependent restriction protein DptF [Clostridium taeniosporum]